MITPRLVDDVLGGSRACAALAAGLSRREGHWCVRALRARERARGGQPWGTPEREHRTCAPASLASGRRRGATVRIRTCVDPEVQSYHAEAMSDDDLTYLDPSGRIRGFLDGEAILHRTSAGYADFGRAKKSQAFFGNQPDLSVLASKMRNRLSRSGKIPRRKAPSSRAESGDITNIVLGRTLIQLGTWALCWSIVAVNSCVGTSLITMT